MEIIVGDAILVVLLFRAYCANLLENVAVKADDPYISINANPIPTKPKKKEVGLWIYLQTNSDKAKSF